MQSPPELLNRLILPGPVTSSDFGLTPHHVWGLAARIGDSKEETHFWIGSNQPGMSTKREASVSGWGNSRLLVLPKRCQRRRVDGKYGVFMVKAG